MKRLKKYISPFTWLIALTMLIKLISAGLELMIPYLMEIILDEIIPIRNTAKIFLFGGFMLLCAFGCLTTNILANRMSAVSAGRITLAIRHDLFARLENLSARQLDSLTVSSAESRLTSDTYNINQLLARLQRVGVRAPILLLGGIAMTLSMEPVLALILVLMLPVIGLIVYYVTQKSIPLYTRQQSVLDKTVRVVQENITGIRVIKALSKTEYEKERFDKINSELTEIDQKAGIITSITNPAATLILNLGLTLVVVCGAFRVNSGACAPGVIVAFLQYFTMILNAMLGVTRIFVMWAKGEASACRVADVLAAPEDMLVQPLQTKEKDAAHIEFRDVSFSYSGSGSNLEHVSFRLEHGQTLGILGATGSGKSTLLNLIMRLYDPDSGTVLIDGHDVRTIPYEQLRKKFGIVFQNDFVAEGTIKDNICFFRNVDESKLVKAANDAQAEFIKDRDGGMNAEVMVRGNNLSGGQKQRLLIARALAADPEILILDDASSALDYQTDANLRRALNQNHRNTTTVVVAQRISSLRSADLILVLSNGKVIGSGTHQSLMKNCDAYRIIAQAQMGDGKEDV